MLNTASDIQRVSGTPLLTILSVDRSPRLLAHAETVSKGTMRKDMFANLHP